MERLPPFKETLACGEFSIREGMAYFAGAVGVQLTSIALVQWLPFFYRPPQGSSHTVYITLSQMTVMMMIGRIMDAVSDPAIGMLSDRTKTRWGRRRPYILFGNFPLALSFFLLWLPPVHGISSVNFYYSAAMVSFYWWMFTVVLVPFLALWPELAQSDRGRVTLGVYWSVGMTVGMFASFFLSSLLIEHLGYPLMGLCISLLSLLCFLAPGTVIRERYHTSSAAVSFSLKEAATVFQNKPFVIFALSFLVFNLGLYTMQTMLPYYNEVVLGGKEGDIAKYMGLFGAATLIASLVYQSLEKRTSVKALFGSALLFMGLLFPVMYLIGIASFPISKGTLLLFFIPFAGIPQAAIFIFQGPLLGHAIDLDAKRWGKRREALYSGVNGILWKLAITSSSGIMWGLFHTFGYSRAKPLGVLLAGPLCGLLALIGFGIFSFYPKIDSSSEPLTS